MVRIEITNQDGPEACNLIDISQKIECRIRQR